jgi:hypothetical protein
MDIFFEGMHFSIRERYLVLIGATALLSLFTGMFGAWVGSYFGGRRGARKEMRLALAKMPAHSSEAKLTELAQTVDVMALEVERIAEGQRFLVKLLSEREAAQMHLPSPPAKMTTPH